MSLPRSLSSFTYHACAIALGLKRPSWTSDGEILNNDRSALFAGGGLDGRKYTLPAEAATFEAVTDFLSEIVEPEGFAYKDVVQPWVCANWLKANARLNVLRIAPNVAHVALAMITRGWLYPASVATCGGDTEERLVSGLIQAYDAFSGMPGDTVAYDDLISAFDTLWDVLSRMYPEAELAPVTLNDYFAVYRKKVMERRQGETYQRLKRIEHRLRDETGLAA